MRRYTTSECKLLSGGQLKALIYINLLLWRRSVTVKAFLLADLVFLISAIIKPCSIYFSTASRPRGLSVGRYEFVRQIWAVKEVAVPLANLLLWRRLIVRGWCVWGHGLQYAWGHRLDIKSKITQSINKVFLCCKWKPHDSEDITWWLRWKHTLALFNAHDGSKTSH